MSDNRGPKERAYDEHFSPLVAQLIELAKQHEITLFVHCCLDGGEDEDGEDRPDSVTTSIPQPEDADIARRFMAVARPPTNSFAAFTVFSGGGRDGDPS